MFTPLNSHHFKSPRKNGCTFFDNIRQACQNAHHVPMNVLTYDFFVQNGIPFV